MARADAGQVLDEPFDVVTAFDVIAPIDLILTNQDVVQPDIVVVTNPAQVSARAIEGPPALVVEVLSPSTRDHDRTAKARRYAALGIAHYWLVDPDSSRMECYRAQAGVYALVVEGHGEASLAHPDWPDTQEEDGSGASLLRFASSGRGDDDGVKSVGRIPCRGVNHEPEEHDDRGAG